jgi:DNA polymerase-3 subunit delta
MPELKPAYLIHGDDHGAVAERRAGLRALAAGTGADAAGVEVLEGDAATPAAAAAALATMTLAAGRRVIIVEGAERWRDRDVEEQLAPALASMPPDTTLAVFAREEARAKAPAALHAAIEGAGGQVVAQMTVKRWELPRWVRAQGVRLGLDLDEEAARALVAQVGERQQRLLRELEKLALEQDASPGADGAARRCVGAEEIRRLAARSAQWSAFALADALLAGDGHEALRTYLRLREQGERPTGLVYLIARRLRDALAVSARLQAGESAAAVKRTLQMPSRAAEGFIAAVSRADPERLRAALVALAELELDSRGGAPVPAARTPGAGLSEETLLVRAVEAVAG